MHLRAVPRLGMRQLGTRRVGMQRLGIGAASAARPGIETRFESRRENTLDHRMVQGPASQSQIRDVHVCVIMNRNFTPTHTRLPKPKPARTHARMHARTHARAHARAHARTRARTHHARARARTHARTHPRARAHAHTMLQAGNYHIANLARVWRRHRKYFIRCMHIIHARITIRAYHAHTHTTDRAGTTSRTCSRSRRRSWTSRPTAKYLTNIINLLQI